MNFIFHKDKKGKNLSTVLTTTLDKRIGEDINVRVKNSLDYFGTLEKDEQGFYVQAKNVTNSSRFTSCDTKIRLRPGMIISSGDRADYRILREPKITSIYDDATKHRHATLHTQYVATDRDEEAFSSLKDSIRATRKLAY